jgi:hypothetical protein
MSDEEALVDDGGHWDPRMVRDLYQAGGDIKIDIHGPGIAPAPQFLPSSFYLEQVRQIAPRELLGRDAELAELAQFCLDQDRDPYTWWQAPAWAGKTALMSTFVTMPPREVRDQARIVSFFITARLASQDTSEAFVAALLGQLADLLNRPSRGIPFNTWAMHGFFSVVTRARSYPVFDLSRMRMTVKGRVPATEYHRQVTAAAAMVSALP